MELGNVPRNSAVVVVATPSDYPEMSNVICRCLREVNIKDYPKDVIESLCTLYGQDNIAKHLAGCFVVALKRGIEVIGTGALKGTEIIGVFMHPSCRGRGLGRHIMAALETEARRQGLPEVELHSSTTAFNFYKDCGYQSIEEVVREGRGASTHMRKQL